MPSWHSSQQQKTGEFNMTQALLRLYVITDKRTNEILAVSHGKAINCFNMPEEMYINSECKIHDLPYDKATELLKTKWKFKRSDN